MVLKLDQRLRDLDGVKAEELGWGYGSSGLTIELPWSKP